MKLISIKMNNFRQYYGENNIINFNDSNITVVLGENGCGKTGIFRAMMFALFGITEIEDDNGDKNIHLVNITKLNENIGAIVTAEVVVEVENDGKRYIVKRTYPELKEPKTERIISGKKTVSLKIKEEDGNLNPREITDEYEVLTIMDEIFNSKLKDFYFFNGEKIEALSKTDAVARETIKNGILKLLQIDNIDSAIRILTQIQRDKQNKIKASSTNLKLTEAYKNRDDAINNIEKYKVLIDEKISEISYAREQLNNVEEKLKKNEGVKEILEKKSEILKDIANKEKELKNEKNYLSQYLQDGLGNVLINNYTEEIFVKLKNKTDENKIPEFILRKIIDEKVCLCGQCFDENSSIAKMFKMQLETTKDNSDKLYRNWYDDINRVMTLSKSYLDKIDNPLKNVRRIKDEIDVLQKKLSIINEEYQQYAVTSDKEIRELEDTRKAYSQELERLQETKTLLSVNLENTRKILEEKNEEISNLEKTESINKLEIEKKQFVTDIIKMLQDIYDNYTRLVKEMLGKEMHRLFKQLIADKDIELIDQIIVDDEYRIDIKNQSGDSILQDISSGQKQVLSLSLIIALSKLACEENIINVPLFMDTPFGRISLENRRKIINNIPKEMEQWILLATDTELTFNEVNYLLETGKWNNAYILKQEKVGCTTIKKINDVKGILNGGE